MPQKSNASKKPRVVVGMSGGVDSSVSAYLLKEQGFDVVGLFMKNWEETNDCGCCTAEGDFADVRRVCETIGIPYYSVNFSAEYRDKVFKHFLDGLRRGITPNPDVLCNREIKFGPFLDFAKKMDADFIATGHYARVAAAGNRTQLLRAKDKNKDQTYFLCALRPDQIAQVIFPVGDLTKPEVREIARKAGLVTHDKKDSTGICFIGERNFNNFLREHLGDREGEIKTLDGRVVGRHKGLCYYTIGQGKGMGLGATKTETDKWFVVKKDLSTNTLFVNNGDCPELYSRSLVAADFNWISDIAAFDFRTKTLTAKTRYRQPDQECTVEIVPRGTFSSVRVTFKNSQRAVTAGQWVVLYDGEVCLGGGEITEVGE